MNSETIARVSATETEIARPDGTCALVDENKGVAEQIFAGSALFAKYFHPGSAMYDAWKGTPWIVSTYSGSLDSGRYQAVRDWCEAQFGEEHALLFGRIGKWQAGHATIDGFTWFGFATREMMDAFAAVWPNEVVAAKGGAS